jgi:PAS domain S-box-containing protein
MRQTKAHQFLRSAALSLFGSVAVLLVTYGGYRIKLDLATTALLCLLVIVLVSLRGRFVPAAIASIVAVLSVNYFFVPPLFTIAVSQPFDEIAVTAFLATALVISRLVTRQRQSLKEVQALNERLQLVVDSIPSLVARTRADGSLEFMNQRWREYLGLSLEEAKDWGWTAALHPEDRERFVDQWRAALSSGEPLESEARMRRADGEYHWLSIGVVPLRDSEGKIDNWYGASTDIEERKRAEERARLADRERDIVIDTIPALLWSTLPDGSSDFNNQRWLEYTGLSEKEALGWGFRSVIHPEDYQRLVTEWAARYAAGEPIEDEARLRRSDGQYRWFLHRAVPLRDERGNIVKWYGTSADIEDLKCAENELRDHARLLDLTHDTVFVRDINDIITYWNRGAEALYGWSRDEAVGKVMHQLTQTIFPAPLDEINAELFRTGRWEGELVHTKRDGTQVVVASRWSLQRDEVGRPTAILETNNDITERKRLDNELRRSQAYLIAAQELGNTGSWARRLSTGEIYWSEEVFRIFGVDPKTIPRRELLSQLWHPDDRQFADRTIDDAARDKRNYEMDVRVVRPDGSLRYVHIRGQPVFDQSGETDEFIGVIMDITDRKRTERALRRARERVLQARFAAVLDERTRLARDIHDTLLQGFTGIALKLVAASSRVTEPPESIAALRDLIGLAQQTLTDARRAVWDLRSPSLSAGDLPAAVRTAAEDCVRGTILELEFDVGGPPRPVDSDVEAVVLRVAQEAVTNVVKHADARTVRVRLSFETRRIRLSIIDDGRGFAVEPDFHAYGGHWGLLGMRERASQVRGKLSLRSTPGHGTEVVLLVPYAAIQRSPAATAAASQGD